MRDGHMNHPYGVMQGRLSPPEGGRFQSFPREGWCGEFAKARAVGFDYIEWIHDGYGHEVNPIFSEAGLREFDALKAEHGIGTPALCGDWFMEFPFVRCTRDERDQRVLHLHELIPIAARIGASRIVLPLVDNSSMQSDEEQLVVADVLRDALSVAKDHGVELHVEADLGPADFSRFLARIPDAALKVNWDSGNSSGLGYVATEEFASYGDRVGSVHIKDRFRKPGGGVETRPLGTGSADFDDVFEALRRSNYGGGATLQVARGPAGDEVNFLRSQLEFVQRYW
jgi:L-ribulose-5-phosphate 3-epimerase